MKQKSLIKGFFSISTLLFINSAHAAGFGAKIVSFLNSIASEVNTVLGPAGILVLVLGAANYVLFKAPISDVVKRVAVGLIIAAAASQIIEMLTSSSASGF